MPSGANTPDSPRINFHRMSGTERLGYQHVAIMYWNVYGLACRRNETMQCVVGSSPHEELEIPEHSVSEGLQLEKRKEQLYHLGTN